MHLAAIKGLRDQLEGQNPTALKPNSGKRHTQVTTHMDAAQKKTPLYCLQESGAEGPQPRGAPDGQQGVAQGQRGSALRPALWRRRRQAPCGTPGLPALRQVLLSSAADCLF